jgi:ligand-binding sensor domain-containing protein/signal transduction histidine kinase
MRVHTAALLALLVGTGAGADQEPERLTLRRISAEAGLSHNSVYALLQDRQGFLWVGTVDGLNRYDGYEFVTWRHDPLDTSSLSNQVVRALFEDTAGGLWVGTDDGLNRLDRGTGRFTRYVLQGAAAARHVWAVHEDRAGQLWAGSDQGLFRYDGAADRFDLHPLASPPPGTPGGTDVTCLGEDSRGTLWALTASYEGQGATLHPVVRDGPPRRGYPLPAAWGETYLFALDDAGRFWLKDVGPAAIDEAAGQVTPPPVGSLPRPVFAMVRRPDGTLWIGSEAGLVEVDLSSGRRRVHHVGPPGSGWLDNSVRALASDRSGALWIGTYAGLQRHDPHAKRFTHWRHDPLDARSLASSAVSALRFDAGGALWVGTFGAGLDRFDPATGIAEHFRHRPGDPASLRDDVVWALLAEPDGRLWVATEAGLCAWEPRRRRFEWHDLVIPRDPVRIDRTRIFAMARDGRGVLWLGGLTGLYSLDPHTGRAARHLLGEADDQRTHAVTALMTQDDGTLWAGSGTLGLVLVDVATGLPRRRIPLTLPDGKQLRSEGIWSLHRDRGGHLWLGNGAGFSRFDPQAGTFTHFFARDGLPGSVVYGILEDERGRLWLSTNRGLARFDPAAPRAGFRNYDVSDGIGTMEFNRQAALVGPGGRFFFGGIDGLLAFHPAQIADDPHPPPVVLTAVQSQAREGTVVHNPHGLEELRLSYADDSVAFEFAALAYGNPSRNRYAYRLEGFDRDWVAAGTRRQARYTNLPPGRYTFRLRAANHDGVWNEQGLALPVVIRPPYWQTWWFRVLLGAAALALLASVYHLRVSRLLEMERLRLRIASDLHDDLSSDLSAIAVATDMLQRRPGLPEPDRDRLGELRDKALQMAGALRDTVWYVQPEHDTLAAMVARMRTTATDLLGPTPCVFEVALGDDDAPVHMGVRRDLVLLYKELVHNAARHARARQVTIAIREAGGRLDLHVSDDGVGFDPTARYTGEGLPSLRRRAERMGARLEIASRPGEGTHVSVVAELARTRDGAAGRRGRIGFGGHD